MRIMDREATAGAEQSLAALGGYEYGSPAGEEGGGRLPRRSTFFWIFTRARTRCRAVAQAQREPRVVRALGGPSQNAEAPPFIEWK